MSAKLSICIPTLNRAALLEDMLFHLCRLTADLEDRLEIVVADNASTDQTREVVEACPLKIRYGRQTTTVGFTKNVLFATTELATGDYIWLVGDDDLILPGAIELILESLDKAPDVDYHYLNFGWVNAQKRGDIIHQQQGQPDPQLMKRLQFNQAGWLRLAKIEDLSRLPSDNVSAAFSGIFCFVVKKHYFEDGIAVLSPSDSLDGSSTNMSDCFPHAMITLPPLAGKPVAYVGTPCLLQGVNGWEWGSYAYKNMILGTYQLFQWLESTAFDSDSLKLLWESYFQMAGRLFLRMQEAPEEHSGVELVLENAIPFCAGSEVFWHAFLAESRMFTELTLEVEILANQLKPMLASNPEVRLGLWGIAGRGTQLIKQHPELANHLIWVTDKSLEYQQLPFLDTGLTIQPPETLASQQIDILVIATRRDFISEVEAFASEQMTSLETVSLAGSSSL